MKFQLDFLSSKKNNSGKFIFKVFHEFLNHITNFIMNLKEFPFIFISSHSQIFVRFVGNVMFTILFRHNLLLYDVYKIVPQNVNKTSHQTLFTTCI